MSNNASDLTPEPSLSPNNHDLVPDLQPELKARLTVVETVAYQGPGQEAVVADSRYSVLLESEEQPYGPRRLKIGEDWQFLSKGCWLENVSLLTVENNEGRWFSVRPTQEQLREIEAKVLELGIVIEQLVTSTNTAVTTDPPGKRTMWSEPVPKASPAPVQVEPTVVPVCTIPPRGSCRLYPIEFSRYLIRCRKGEAQTTVYAFPKD